MKYTVNGARIVAVQNETLVAGARGVHFAEFTFDASWDEYVTRKAIFKRENIAVEQLIVDGVCVIPWEALEGSGTLLVGVYGESADKRRPTLWASPKSVNEGAGEADASREPTPDVWQQLLAEMNAVVPHIGENGNWYVGDVDTGTPAQGPRGEDGDDYVLTNADKAKIVDAVLAALPNGDEVSY